jgi:hypothetical protein
MLDSIQAVIRRFPKGIVCNTGILGNEWIIKNFEPLLSIPSTVKLAVYKSETITAANSTKALEQIVDGVAKGCYHVNLDKVFHFHQIVDAYRYMEDPTVFNIIIHEVYVTQKLETIQGCKARRLLIKRLLFLGLNRMLRRGGIGRLQVIASGAKDHFEQNMCLMGIREPIKRVNL